MLGGGGETSRAAYKDVGSTKKEKEFDIEVEATTIDNITKHDEEDS